MSGVGVGGHRSGSVAITAAGAAVSLMTKVMGVGRVDQSRSKVYVSMVVRGGGELEL